MRSNCKKREQTLPFFAKKAKKIDKCAHFVYNERDGEGAFSPFCKAVLMKK